MASVIWLKIPKEVKISMKYINAEVQKLDKMDNLCIDDKIAHLQRLRVANQRNLDFLESLWRNNTEPAIFQNVENNEGCSRLSEYNREEIVEVHIPSDF
ncbi:unnamed protein product [Dibothriocephalus latus]|uniref:Uncharacterized protein n=1 Tax=Dibothriocephalus latus TaxID=60516 RepID=A0A3P7LVB0_DIBLA|nr:unnamed protein product [Dibothriocephalus latus]